MKYLLSLVFLLINTYSIAEDGFDEDEFDDEIQIIVATDSISESKTTLYGSSDFEAHYNFNNEKDLSLLKLSTDILAEHKLDSGYKIKANLKAYYDFIYDLDNNYTITPTSYKHELDLNELSIEGEIAPEVDLKIGRQIVVWGKSDSIRITDILNPLDNRIPGLVDIKNLRLGRFMSKLDYYVNQFNLSVISLHENRYTKNPAYGSDFKLTPDKAIQEPSNNLDNTGLALSLTGAFEGFDIGLYFADTYIDKAYLDNDILHYDNRSKMLGAAYNKVYDDFLVKAEMAHFDHIKYSGVTDAKARSDILLGLEYNGIRDGSISYEIALRNIHNYENTINTASNGHKPKKEYQQVARYAQSYLNQTLDFLATISVFGKQAQDGGSARVSLEYALDDRTSISGGIVDYISGDNPTIDAYKDNDRIFTKISYLF